MARRLETRTCAANVKRVEVALPYGRASDTLAIVRLPLSQKRDEVALEHRSGRFKFAIPTAVKQLTLSIQNGNGRHAFVQGNAIGLYEFGILFAFADINVH